MSAFAALLFQLGASRFWMLGERLQPVMIFFRIDVVSITGYNKIKYYRYMNLVSGGAGVALFIYMLCLS